MINQLHRRRLQCALHLGVVTLAIATRSIAESPPFNELLAEPTFIQIPGPNPILVPEAGWDADILETSDAFKDGNTYYLYYHAKGTLGYQIGVATSSRPLGPFQRAGEKPLLGVGPPGSWDDKYVACAFILKERSNKYYMYYSAKRAGEDEQHNRNIYSIGIATADNPLGPWKKHPANPIIHDFGFVGSVVKHNGRYMMFNSAPLGGAGEDYAMINRDYGPLSVAIADTPEGPWQVNPDPVMWHGQPGEWDDAGMSEAEVVYHSGVFHMFYAAPRRATEKRKSFETIGYAYSFDGLNWHKSGRNPVVPREAEPNVSSYAEVHAIFEMPFIYLYHTLRYEEMPIHAAGRQGFPWLEDIGVQAIATQRPFSLEWPVMDLASIASGATTSFSQLESKTIPLGCVQQASISITCRFDDAAREGLRVHVRASSDGMTFDSVDTQHFEVSPRPGIEVRQSFPLNSNARFVKILVENLDSHVPTGHVQIICAMKG